MFELTGGVLGGTKIMLDTSERDKQIREEVLNDFSKWLVKYKVIPEVAMRELLRDYKEEKGEP